MKTLVLLISFFFILKFSYSQDAKSYYDLAMEKAIAGKFEEAIKLFDKSIELEPNEYVAWYNRGISKAVLGDYEGALIDYEQTVKLNPDYKKGYLNRGTAKKRLTDYSGAIADYSYLIKIDPNYADAYYNRGLVYEMLSKKDSACADFVLAKETGLKDAQRKINKCNDTSAQPSNYFSILRLTKFSESNDYGFTPEQPIKVGAGPNGGPANQQAYLNLLRDKQGRPIYYKRIGSCCMFDTPNGIGGKGMLDKYEITFRNENNEEVKTVVYISFYDYEELKIIKGFKTVASK